MRVGYITICHLTAQPTPSKSSSGIGVDAGPDYTPPAGLEPAIFGLEVRRLVHYAKGHILMVAIQ